MIRALYQGIEFVEEEIPPLPLPLPPPPIATSVVKKRQTPHENLSFLKPTKKRNKFDHTSKIVEISGRIGEILYPKAQEAFTGFCVITINGYRIVDNTFPFLDRAFVFHLRCERRKSEFSQAAEYTIIDYKDIPYEPVPLTCMVLKAMMINLLGFDEDTALTKIMVLNRFLVEHGKSAPISPEWLLENYPKKWLLELSKQTLLFKYEKIADLGRFWKPATLSRLDLPSLERLSHDFHTQPLDFCFSWKNNFDLPELKSSVLKENRDLFQEDTFTDADIEGVAGYERVKSFAVGNCLIPLRREKVIGRMNVPWGIKHKIIKPVCENRNGVLSTRYYIYNDWRMMEKIGKELRKLSRLPPDLAPFKKNPPSKLKKLTKDQLEIYGRLKQQNLVVILGDGGNGKTELGKYIFHTFKKKNVLAMANYGRVASNLKRWYGKGMTICKALSQIRHGTKIGEKLQVDTQVLILDELSTITLRLLRDILAAFPNILKIIMIGDEKQMPPYGRGSVIESFIAKYQNTPVIGRLTKLLRSGGDVRILKHDFDRVNAGRHNLEYSMDDHYITIDRARILKHNFNQINAGGYQLHYSTDLHSEHPFIITDRMDISPYVLKARDPTQRIKILEDNLGPIVDFYPDQTSYQLITQKNDVRMDLNHALYNLLKPSTDSYNRSTFYVGEKILFRLNDDGSTTGPKYLRSGDVRNGEIKRITAIYDIDPTFKIEEDEDAESSQDDEEEEESTVLSYADIPKIKLRSTSEQKKYPTWHRLLIFDDNTQVNLRHYSIGNIIKGSAATTASYQGSECAVVIVYIHTNFSYTLTRRELYTAITRASQRVIVICNRGEKGDLSDSDIARIARNPGNSPECTLANRLPNFN